MTGNIKGLGLVLVAALAMSAVVVSTASGHVPDRFTAPAAATIRGESHEGVLVFAGEGLEHSCAITFHGVSPSGSGTVSFESQTIRPTFTGCTAESIIGTMEDKVTGFGHYGPSDEGCDLVFTAPGRAHIVCEPGKEVTIDVGTCIIHIPPQFNIGTLSYTTGVRLSKHDLTVHLDLTSITASYTDGFGCPLSGSTESSNSSLVGKTTVWAEVAGAPVDLTWDATVA